MSLAAVDVGSIIDLTTVSSGEYLWACGGESLGRVVVGVGLLLDMAERQ